MHGPSAYQTFTGNYYHQTFAKWRLQAYSVEDILPHYAKSSRGADVAAKLKQGQYYTGEERVLMYKVLGKFLMNNCKV